PAVQLKHLEEYVADGRDEGLALLVVKGVQLGLCLRRRRAGIGVHWYGVELVGRGGDEALPRERDLVERGYVAQDAVGTVGDGVVEPRSDVLLALAALGLLVRRRDALRQERPELAA